MTRSIFDPTGRETEHSGSAFLGAEAAQISHIPPDQGDETSGDDESDVIDMSANPVPDVATAAGTADRANSPADESSGESP